MHKATKTKTRGCTLKSTPLAQARGWARVGRMIATDGVEGQERARTGFLQMHPDIGEQGARAWVALCLILARTKRPVATYRKMLRTLTARCARRVA